MSKDMFRDMADQMKPSDQLVRDLHDRLDQLDQAMALHPEGSATSDVRVIRPGRWRMRATAFLAAAACLAGAAGAGAWLAGRSPVAPASDSVAAGPVSGQPAAAGEAENRDEPPKAAPAEDYAAIYEAVSEAASAGSIALKGDIQLDMDVTTPLMSRTTTARATADSMEAPLGGGTGQYSATNTQVAGIDEGDIVKTDGRAIYVASGPRVTILLPDGASTSQVASLDTTPEGATIPGAVLDMMLAGQTLVVFIQEYDMDTTAIGGTQPKVYVPYSVGQTTALLYDVTDPADPSLITALGQSGSYKTSRLTGEVLYLVTDYFLDDPTKIAQDQPDTYVPQIWDDKVGVAVDPDCIEVIDPINEVRYTVASAIDLTTAARLSTQTVLAGADTVYMTQDNLYLAATQWDGKISKEQLETLEIEYSLDGDGATNLVRLSLNDGQLAVAAEGTVPGRLLNQFSLDEYDGYLRLVVDVSGWQPKADNWLQQTSLLVLDSDLTLAGVVPKLVTGESVKSVRFTGEVGYVVTFKQTDPLFAVDLSEPTKPVVMSELKIPGFSAYLHPWPGDLLLGVGVHANDDGRQLGLKLSMFDTADPYAVSELTSQPVRGDDSEALFDHKAVLVDTERGLVGFPVLSFNDKGQAKRSYVLYTYQGDQGFKLRGSLAVAGAPTDHPFATCISQWGRDGCGWMPGPGAEGFTRGVLVDENLYVVTAGQVDVYSLAELQPLTSVTLED